MCIKNVKLSKSKDIKEDVLLSIDQLSDIMNAVGIIKPVFNGIEVLNTKLDSNTRLIREEIKERKDEDNEIKDNYKAQFRKVNENIKELGKTQAAFLWKIIIILLGSTLFLFITATWKQIVEIFFP